MIIKTIMRYLILLWLIALPAYGQEDGIENLRNTGKAFASVARHVSPSAIGYIDRHIVSGTCRLLY